MNEITRFETTERMSKIVIHNNIIYLCGQVGAGADGPFDIVGQTEEMLSRVDALLEKAGSSREHILSATIYVRDMKDFAGMNKVWDAWIPVGNAPARACVEAKMARPDLLVEVSVVAVVKE